jgi:hypothetical protein
MTGLTGRARNEMGVRGRSEGCAAAWPSPRVEPSLAELPAEGSAEIPVHCDPQFASTAGSQLAQIPALAPHEPASHANAILDDFGEY